MKLKDKVALITGAGSGIGQATALLFAREGARVAVVDVREEAAKATAQEIERAGGQALALRADVSRGRRQSGGGGADGGALGPSSTSSTPMRESPSGPPPWRTWTRPPSTASWR
jgi:NAD(P)-dependent dehydrogenase (short-subunit alcohol dehydrogenase family)